MVSSNDAIVSNVLCDGLAGEHGEQLREELRNLSTRYTGPGRYILNLNTEFLDRRTTIVDPNKLAKDIKRAEKAQKKPDKKAKKNSKKKKMSDSESDSDSSTTSDSSDASSDSSNEQKKKKKKKEKRNSKGNGNSSTAATDRTDDQLDKQMQRLKLESEKMKKQLALKKVMDEHEKTKKQPDKSLNKSGKGTCRNSKVIDGGLPGIASTERATSSGNLDGAGHETANEENNDIEMSGGDGNKLKLERHSTNDHLTKKK